MRNNTKLIIVSLLCILTLSAYGQDVIVRKNGLLIQADVREIGLEVIKYRKASDPEGPLYSMYRENIYAIVHDNGDKDYFSKPDETTFTSPPANKEEKKNKLFEKITESSYLFNSFSISIGAGVMESYSEVANTESVSNKSQNLPNIHIRGFTSLFKNFEMGLQLSFGKYEYDEASRNDYDNTLISNNVSEKILSATLAGRYTLNSKDFKPYGIMGIGFNRSRIDSQINFVMAEQNALSVGSSNLIYNAAFLARVGAKLKILDQASLYGDIGTGINLLQFGAEWKIK